MMSKRSRALYEADLQARQSPYVTFGTPLPPLDPSVRDDGSFVPVWKQEVRDEKGRRRLHGAFTGGWSAGYYNTVGSKEGWAPSTFVSSRTNRHKDNTDAAQARPEDYMDDEDLADAEESRKLQTTQSFAGLGLTGDDTSRPGGSAGALAGLFRASGETMGTRLLMKMGWREGQGIGPKVRRTARLDVGRPGDKNKTFLFSPENVVMVSLVKKSDRKGLGFEGQSKLSARSVADDDDESDDARDDDSGITRGLFGRSDLISRKKKGSAARSGGIGVGILNDTGSDDEDPYDMGPRISFNRVIGGDKKKKKIKPKPVAAYSASASGGSASNADTKPKLVFSSKPSILGKGSVNNARLCHDGRPPLSGFILGRKVDSLTSDIGGSAKYPPPTIPPGWRSSKTPARNGARAADGTFVSTADAAKTSRLDPKSRAVVLGEAQLPGKSVFDFLSPEARARIASATGRSDLPEARSEIPAAYALTAEEKREQLLQAVPSLDKATAVAAITRGARGGGPYQDNEGKRSRYRAYLEFQAGIAASLPPKPPGVSDDDWLREFYEFSNCARIFKPMSGPMASRFTTSTSQPASSGSGGNGNGADKTNLVTRPAPKPRDPAEEAAKMGMYGPLTRTVTDFFPTRLLCKRMGVQLPDIARPSADTDARRDAGQSWSSAPGAGRQSYVDSTANAATVHDAASSRSEPVPLSTAASSTPMIQADRNDALEGQRASDDVFRAVFGDSDDDE
ncbi:g patch domain-containing protein 1 [Ophiostoma piceae UAMH 11346]|uniref:G patch domain-containing protein 1 n=1 Tax=Ophiostoma piceae (strain UAMH 11346) TaxID=1262450 RepID=S3BTH5_OPHP1|nr:g patch domain-containing protein 1 [Ophiostoma piceae UAMH 11346]